MSAPGERNTSRRDTENKALLSIGILFASSFAGGIWASLFSSLYYAVWDGVAAGFFLGSALVMTALIASMRPRSE